jgi:hypothetical protein
VRTARDPEQLRASENQPGVHETGKTPVDFQLDESEILEDERIKYPRSRRMS